MHDLYFFVLALEYQGFMKVLCSFVRHNIETNSTNLRPLLTTFLSEAIPVIRKPQKKGGGQPNSRCRKAKQIWAHSAWVLWLSWLSGSYCPSAWYESFAGDLLPVSDILLPVSEVLLPDLFIFFRCSFTSSCIMLPNSWMPTWGLMLFFVFSSSGKVVLLFCCLLKIYLLFLKKIF